MRIVLRVVLILVGVIVVAIVGIGTWVYASSESKLNRTWTVDLSPVEVLTDSVSLARGKYLSVTRGCVECHSADLSGKVAMEGGPMGTFVSANLTSGQGGVGQYYEDIDWVRTIRHGVKPDGHTTPYMPSHDFYYLGDQDLGSLIGYLKSLPPVDNEPGKTKFGPIGRLLLATGADPLFFPAAYIDHDAPRPASPPIGVTVAYGEYVAVLCSGCHGTNYAGGNMGVPNVPPSGNLTPHPEGLGRYTKETFIKAMRTGMKPEGTEIDPFMPLDVVRAMDDVELEAVWLFLNSLPATERPENVAMIEEI